MAGVKGRSGRRPIDPMVTPAIRALLRQKHPSGVTNRVALAETILRLAFEGNETCIKLITERADGKPVEQISATVEHSGGATFLIETVNADSQNPALPDTT